MALSDDIVERIDDAKQAVQEVYDKLSPDKYPKFYNKIWNARSNIEYVVVTLRLLNNIEIEKLDEKWKDEFIPTLKQVRAERKVRLAFLETIDLFNKLEGIQDIIEFYKVCWMLKEKITILLNVVKPKIKPKEQQQENSS